MFSHLIYAYFILKNSAICINYDIVYSFAVIII